MKKFKHRNTAMKDPYHYKMCGLDDIYLMGGYEKIETEYGSGVVIQDQDELHMAIACFLVNSKKTLNGKEIRFLRHEMNLTQAELGRLLRVTDQTVARWEKGECAVDGPAELLVRGLYIAHAGGQLDLPMLAKHLEELEGDAASKHVFAATDEGWKLAA
jgi:putative transcriptional regulator